MTLTQYGRLAEKHWREFLPRKVQELESQGKLQEMLCEAEEKTKDEMEQTMRELQNQGYSPQQAHDTAWELVRGNYILLPPEEVEEVAQNSRNYRITASDEVGAGSLKQKFKQNFAAIQTVKLIEKEQRSATEDEKGILVKYAGWGGIPHVFATPPPYEWREEAKALSEVLTSEEWEAARSSTLNSHYTSPDIIRAIYTGIQRMGFAGGKILEPACGAGHFILKKLSWGLIKA